MDAGRDSLGKVASTESAGLKYTPAWTCNNKQTRCLYLAQLFYMFEYGA